MNISYVSNISVQILQIYAVHFMIKIKFRGLFLMWSGIAKTHPRRALGNSN